MTSKSYVTIENKRWFTTIIILFFVFIGGCTYVVYSGYSGIPYSSWISNVVISHRSDRPDEEVIEALQDEEQNRTAKTILLWTSWFGDRKWSSSFVSIESDTLNFSIGDKQRCYVTYNRKQKDEADAFIFHGRDFDFNDLPPTNRRRHQSWVFFDLESPHHISMDWRKLASLGFNLTMYYTFASSVRFPYSNIAATNYSDIQLAEVNEKIDKFAANFSSKSKDAIWIVSNCHPPSHREDLVEELRNEAGLDVDQWGECNSRSPDAEIAKLGGEEQFFSRYRYMLAFENSLCDDYVTEKFYTALTNSERYGLIPIAFSAANYSKIVPHPNSVIDARTTSMADLAKLFRNLGQPDQNSTVRKFFEWQTRFTVDQTEYKWRGYEALCRKLWSAPDFGVVDDLRSPLGECHD